MYMCGLFDFILSITSLETEDQLFSKSLLSQFFNNPVIYCRFSNPDVVVICLLTSDT